jgi:hypothetical protein
MGLAFQRLWTLRQSESLRAQIAAANLDRFRKSASSGVFAEAVSKLVAQLRQASLR